MNNFEIYTKHDCHHCRRAKALLETMGVDYREYEISSDYAKRLEMIDRSGRFTVPQVFVNGHAVGGSDDLYELTQSGALQALLQIDQKEELKNAA